MFTQVTKFMAGLNELQKKLLVATLVVVVVALFDRLLMAPTLARLSSINNDIMREENDIKQDLRFLAYKDRIIKENKEASVYFTKQIPSEEELIEGFLKRIEALAAEAKITIGKLTPPSSGSSENDFLRYEADLECTGKLADIVTFMHVVNSSEDLLKVTKYSISGKKTDSDDIKSTMTIEKIIIPAGHEKPKPATPKDAPAVSP